MFCQKNIWIVYNLIVNFCKLVTCETIMDFYFVRNIIKYIKFGYFILNINIKNYNL